MPGCLATQSIPEIKDVEVDATGAVPARDPAFGDAMTPSSTVSLWDARVPMPPERFLGVGDGEPLQPSRMGQCLSAPSAQLNR